jgi:hypothetical protein
MRQHKVYILCYPRTASRYFTAFLDSALGPQQVHKTHNRDIVVGNGKIVGLIRNPIDQIASAVAQGLEFDDIKMSEASSDEDLVLKQIKHQCAVYLRTMKAILLRSQIIFDYTFIVEKPEKAASLVLDLLNESDLDLELKIPETQIDNVMTYMKSSKESTRYNFVRKLVEESDLSMQMEKYLEVLEHAYKEEA